MKPWFAAAVLTVLSCFTLTCYFFKIPDDLRRKGKVGRWGTPDAEFNWCEPDYLVADWVAEPVNTVSNLAIMLPPLVFLASHSASGSLWIVGLLQAAIGAGSILFHGSLRYTMQLCDELPMLWYALWCAVIYLDRLKGVRLSGWVIAFSVAVTVGILSTPQHSFWHEVWRGIMSVGFGIATILLAWGSTSLMERMKGDMVDKRKHMGVLVERLHTVGFLSFVTGGLCWLTDNYFCAALWDLPFGLPYPHLHTWWHFFVGTAVHMLLVLFQLDDQRHVDSVRVSFRWFLPAVVT